MQRALGAQRALPIVFKWAKQFQSRLTDVGPGFAGTFSFKKTKPANPGQHRSNVIETILPMWYQPRVFINGMHRRAPGPRARGTRGHACVFV